MLELISAPFRAGRKLLVGSLLLACASLSPASLLSAQEVTVSTEAQLRTAVAAANSSGGGATILVEDGTYTLTDTLYVNAPGVTIAGKSGAREKVVIQGDAMSSSARVGTLVRVAGANFQLRDVTLRRSKYHLIQVVGESNADNPVIRDCVLQDAYQQMVKVSVDVNNTSVSSDGGLVENCSFEYTAGIGPQYYIGGIDAHAAKNWVVRGNTFRGIASPSTSVAEFAVHFWNGSSNNTVERNLIVNCDRGIGFGLDGRGNMGGVIRNNMIYHAANGAPFADVAIALSESPGTQVYNNTAFLEHNFPWSIEYRFASTKNVLIANNLVNRPVQARDGATGTLASNVTNAQSDWFVSAVTANLNLASAPATVVDIGQAVAGLVDDFAGEARPVGAGYDIGADEYSSIVRPRPPTDVRAL